MERNILELKQGQVYKNYKALCEILGEPVKTGKSKQLQLKDWERYFTYHKEGNKFVIDEVFSEPKEKVDGRANNKGGNNKGHYYTPRNCVYRYVNDKNEVIYVGKTKLLRIRAYHHSIADDHLHDWYSEDLKLEYISFDEYGDCSIAEPYFIMKYHPIGNIHFNNNDTSMKIDFLDNMKWHERKIKHKSKTIIANRYNITTRALPKQ